MHAPNNYDCPFCKIVSNQFDGIATNETDLLFRTEFLTAFISSHQWPNNPGHAIIIPNEHHENLYSLPTEFVIPIHAASVKIALAFKNAFACDGVSTRQHNEPAGGQDVWHYQQHVFPRYQADNLYGSKRLRVDDQARASQASSVRQALGEVEGI